MRRPASSSTWRAAVWAAAIAVALLACSEDAPCRSEYASCDEESPCPGGASCTELRWEYGQGNRCERPCRDELDCPYERGRAGRCIDVNREGRFACYSECSSGGDCPAGWVCQPIEVRGVISRICLP